MNFKDLSLIQNTKKDEKLAEVIPPKPGLEGKTVTGKPKPEDYDGCWEPNNVNSTLLDPVFLDFSNGRRNQKIKYLGEMFPSGIEKNSGKPFIEFFQIEKFTGEAKGILAIDLTKESFDTVKGDKS